MNKDTQKNKKMILLTISMIIVILLVALYNGYIKYTEYVESKTQYETYMNTLSGYIETIDKHLASIETYQYDLDRAGEELYFSMLDYYNNSEDQVFKYVFDERFPCRYDFYQNPNDTYVVIAALKENYPDLNSDENISKWTYEVETNNTLLHATVTEYNNLVNSYDELVKKIDRCSYINGSPSLKVIKKNYNDVVVE